MPRTYGTGSAKKVAPGRWRLRVYVGRDPVTGKAIQPSRTVHVPTKGEKKLLRKALRDFQDEVSPAEPGAPSITFGALLDRWLAKVESGKARSTNDTYRAHVEKRIRPRFGHVPISPDNNLSALHLDDFYEELKQEGLAPGTINLVHSIISGAFSQGVKWDLVASNPASKATPPPNRPEEKTPPSPSTVNQLIEFAIGDEDFDIAAFIALASATGARRGELIGLQWGDVDWEKATLYIGRQWVPGIGGQYLQESTKRGESRTFPLTDYIDNVLRWYQDVLRERFPGWTPQPLGWLLSLNGGETPLRAKQVTEVVTTLGQRLEPPVRVHPHLLRHYAATTMQMNGVHPRTAAKLLGQRSLKTLDGYTHSPDALDRAGAEVLGKSLHTG